MDMNKRLQAIEKKLKTEEHGAKVLFILRICAGEEIKRAECSGMSWKRLDGEGLEEFEQRVEADIVAAVLPGSGFKQVLQAVRMTP